MTWFFQRVEVRLPVSALAEAWSIYLYNVCLMAVSTNFWLLSGTFLTNLYTPMNILMTFFSRGSFRLRSFGVIRIRISDPRSVWIMVHQRNRWIHSGYGFAGSFDTPWSIQILDHWSWSRSPQRNAALVSHGFRSWRQVKTLSTSFSSLDYYNKVII